MGSVDYASFGVTSKSVMVGAARMHYIETATPGDEAPFLLIHGWGSSVVNWLETMKLLGAHRRAIAVDLPGFGESSTPNGSYRPEWLAGSVRAFMDALGLSRAVVAGNSLGGLVAIMLAAAWPERVEALIPVDPALPNDGPRPPIKHVGALFAPTLPVVGEALFARYLRREPRAVLDEALQRNFADPTNLSEAMYAARLAEAHARQARTEQVLSVTRSNRQMMWALTGRREVIWRTVRSLSIPTLFVWGDQDRLVPSHIGERAVGEVAGAQLVVLENCGHNPQLECPQEFSAATIAFVRAVAARPPLRA